MEEVGEELELEGLRPPSRATNPLVRDQAFEKMNSFDLLGSPISRKIISKIGGNLLEQVF
jgi:hypothetical protein